MLNLVAVTSVKKKIAVILMTYGSPETYTAKGVRCYLKNVYGGKDPSEENIAEFLRRYKIIGGSPLIPITQNQAAALEKELNAQKNAKYEFIVGAGMRFSQPFIEDVVAKIAKDAKQLIGIIMSPQYSPLIMKGYIRELEEAVSNLKRDNLKMVVAQDWHLEENFLKALALKVKEALKDLPESTPVLFSAHSMPKRVIDREPNYINDLKETAREVAKRAKVAKKRWQFCYQSAGHTPEEWLKPDFEDLMPELAKTGIKHVVIAPIQFLADHLEILYDIEVGAREQAEKYGIEFHRTKSLNTSPFFIKALADIANKLI